MSEGISCQRSRMRSVRTPSRDNADQIARVLDCSPAWLLGVAETLPLADEGTVFACPIIRAEPIPDYGTLYHVYLAETGDIVPTIISGGVQFVPYDWQHLYTRTADEIPETDWLTAGGVPAVMLDGLPRVFA